MIKFRCCHCDKKLVLDDEHAGKGLKCHKCGTENVVPDLDNPFYEERCQAIRRQKLFAIKDLNARGQITDDQLASAIAKINGLPWGLPVGEGDAQPEDGQVIDDALDALHEHFRNGTEPGT